MAKYINDFRQGDTVKIKLNYGSSVDLTDYEFFFTVKESLSHTDEEALLQVHTVAGDYSADDPTNGIVYIVAQEDETITIPAGKYFYDIQEVSPVGEVRTLVPPPEDYKDKILVAPNVTITI